MKYLGQILRQTRERKSLPLRKIADIINVDLAVLSKIERGHRFASRVQVIKLAEYFNINKNELLVAWLSDKILNEVENEDLALKALEAATEKLKNNKTKK